MTYSIHLIYPLILVWTPGGLKPWSMQPTPELEIATTTGSLYTIPSKDFFSTYWKGPPPLSGHLLSLEKNSRDWVAAQNCPSASPHWILELVLYFLLQIELSMIKTSAWKSRSPNSLLKTAAFRSCLEFATSFVWRQAGRT